MATDWSECGVGMQERMLDTNFRHIRIHYSTDPAKDAMWAKKHSIRYGGMQSPKWRREMEIDYSAVEGQMVYPMLSPDHIQHYAPGESWTVFRVIDHGIRHPAVCLWFGVNRHGDRHIYREYYQTGKTVTFNCEQVLRLTPDDEYAIKTLIDPSTRQRVPLSNKDKAPVSILSLYNQSLGLSCMLADNSRAGYDTVRDGLLSVLARNVMRKGEVDYETSFAKEYFRETGLSSSELIVMAQKPALTFEPDVRRVFREMRNMRFKEITGDLTQKAAPEEIMDFEDDGPDCVRYAMQTKLLYTYPSRGKKAEVGSHLYELEQKRIRRNPKYINRMR